jgi:hypothetical protein
MTTTKTPNRATRTLSFTRILAGIAQHVTAAILVAGKSVTPQALSAIFNAFLQAQADLDAARGVVAAKQQARDAALTAAVAMVPPLRKWAELTFGDQSPILQDFGFEAARVPVVSAETKAEAAAKGQATRKAKKAALASVSAAPAATPPTGAAPAAPIVKA